MQASKHASKHTGASRTRAALPSRYEWNLTRACPHMGCMALDLTPEQEQRLLKLLQDEDAKPAEVAEAAADAAEALGEQAEKAADSGDDDAALMLAERANDAAAVASEAAVAAGTAAADDDAERAADAAADAVAAAVEEDQGDDEDQGGEEMPETAAPVEPAPAPVNDSEPDRGHWYYRKWGKK